MLGVSPAADAFKAALRIPNLMQNLLGGAVGVVHPRVRPAAGGGRHDEAGRLAGAIAGLLIAVTGAVSLVGIVFAAPLTKLLVPGYTADTYDLTVELTRIMFPGIAFLVLSAWCLGVLNSHRQFFLSYVAPVLWSAAQIVALVAGVLVVGGYSEASQARPGGGAGLGCWSAACCSSGSRSGRCAGCSARVRLSLDTSTGGPQRAQPVRPGAAGPGRHPDHGVGRPVAGQLPGRRGGVVADLHDGAVPAAGRPVRGERGGRELPDLSQVEVRPRDPAALPAPARGQHGPHRLVRGPTSRCSSWWAT